MIGKLFVNYRYLKVCELKLYFFEEKIMNNDEVRCLKYGVMVYLF